MSLHSKLLEKWKLCEFGVKTRVFNEIPQQQIDYILKHENYRDENKIQEVLKCIDKCSKELLNEVIKMTDEIRNIEVK
tara:strand:+ start:524 stop:757 length:234 start_codon:yes stop_codon:yes gene_type:complete